VIVSLAVIAFAIQAQTNHSAALAGALNLDC
jgi:hypothetical protein